MMCCRPPHAGLHHSLSSRCRPCNWLGSMKLESAAGRHPVNLDLGSSLQIGLHSLRHSARDFVNCPLGFMQ